jgi:hypothetical protein
VGALHTHFKDDSLPLLETARFSDREHSQQSLVLRC